MYEMGMRPQPRRGLMFEAEMGDPLERNQPAIGDVAGEARLFRTEQRLPHLRMNAVGADHEIGFGRQAVRPSAKRTPTRSPFSVTAMQRRPTWMRSGGRACINTAIRSARWM